MTPAKSRLLLLEQYVHHLLFLIVIQCTADLKKCRFTLLNKYIFYNVCV